MANTGGAKRYSAAAGRRAWSRANARPARRLRMGSCGASCGSFASLKLGDQAERGCPGQARPLRGAHDVSHCESNREAGPAAARGSRLRVVDAERGADQFVDEIDL